VFPLSGLNPRFLLGYEALRLRSGQVYLSSAAERGNEMKSQKWGLCPRLLWVKLIPRNAGKRNEVGMCWNGFWKTIHKSH